jgi:hypothetical protein
MLQIWAIAICAIVRSFSQSFICSKIHLWHIFQIRAIAIFLLGNPNFLMVIHAIMTCTNDHSGIPQIHYYLIWKSVLQFAAILKRMHPLKVWIRPGFLCRRESRSWSGASHIRTIRSRKRRAVEWNLKRKLFSLDLLSDSAICKIEIQKNLCTSWIFFLNLNLG